MRAGAGEGTEEGAGGTRCRGVELELVLMFMPMLCIRGSGGVGGVGGGGGSVRGRKRGKIFV